MEIKELFDQSVFVSDSINSVLREGAIAAGLTAKEAARKLAISPKTADHHIQSVYAKIGVTTRAAAALYAVEHGLVRPGETQG